MRVIPFLAGLCSGIFVTAFANGQPAEPERLTPLASGFLRDYAETRGFTLGRPVMAKPTPDGKAVLFLRARPRASKLQLYEFDVATGQTRELLTPEQLLKGAQEKLSPEEKARRERMRVSVSGFTNFQLSKDGSLILLSLSGKLYTVRRSTGEVRELKTTPGTILDPKLSRDGKSVAYVRDYDVYVFDLTKGKERRLTLGGTERVSHGLAEFVAQEEMDRYSGYWWSPDSRSIVYEEADASEVEIWYVTDPAKPEQPPHPSFYPRPGKANVKVRLGVTPARGGKTIWIQWDARRYPYLTKVDWDEHGPLTVEVQSRDQKELVLLKVDLKTGKTAPLLIERDPVWLNLDQQVPVWLEDGSGFLWTSEHEGAPQLELRRSDGQFERVLVPPNAGYQGFIDVDTKLGYIYFSASTDPTQSQLHRVPLTGAESVVALTKTVGLNSATFAKNHSIYVHQEISLETMPKTTVRRADGSLIGELPSVAENPSFVPRARVMKVGSGNGFYASIVRPRDFDAKRRYPVLVDVYGGPHGKTVVAAMSAHILKQWLADQGFIVVSIDGRGTPGRGREWERAIAKHFGSVPLADQVAGLKALRETFPELDLERVGIFGWSFGGYMSALAVLKRPDIFRAAMAGAPVVDWLDYDTHYTERYLGMPDTDATAYKEGSLLTYAGDLSRPLLLVHGTSDDNVYFRHTLKLTDALFRAGKDFELLPLSGLTHMVPDPVVTERLWSRIAEHFRKYLRKPSDPKQ
jgi:dipeptidyl-peptidase-4